MSDKKVDSLFGENPVPQPDAIRKAENKKAALRAFAEMHDKKNLTSDQGNVSSLRPTSKHQPKRNKTMFALDRRIWISGIAACCVVAIGTVSMRYSLDVQNLSPTQEVRVEPYPKTELSDEKAGSDFAKQSTSVNEQVQSPSSINGEPEYEAESFRRRIVEGDKKDELAPLNSVPTDTSLNESRSMAEADVVEEEIIVTVVDEVMISAPEHKRDAEANLDAIYSDDMQIRVAEGQQRIPAAQIEAPSQPKAAKPAKLQMSKMQAVASADLMPQTRREYRDKFSSFKENPITLVAENPVSTFSIDVDTASYSAVRRQLNQGVLPEKNAVRIEEMINYFDYAYPIPENKKQPFNTLASVSNSPWKKGNKLLHIGLKGYEITENKPDSNLVFLLDVSGSMSSADKLPLVKQSMSLLLDTLKSTDTVAIVVYAGAAGTVLEPTKVKEKAKILAALNRLNAGGSTAGGEGLALAYQLAELNYQKNAVNRILLATDGDFNVGVTQDERLEDFVARKREKGIYLSVLGFGQGNYQDQRMQTLAQNGNGVAAYIDTLSEAQKVLVEQATSSLFPIANDVKIQVEFNPERVSEYRLVGYETRALKREDFNNDKVDAGDIGAGHTVTAIYEFTPVGSEANAVDELRYGKKTSDLTKKSKLNREYGFLKLRYKLPGQSRSKLVSLPITEAHDIEEIFEYDKKLANEIEFSTAVASFAQLLRGSQYAGDVSYDDIIAQALQSKGDDAFGYRTEFIQLVRKAKIARAM